MNRKQFLYLVLAVLLFAATGVLSVRVNRSAVQDAEALTEQTRSIFSPRKSESPDSPYVALVDVSGTIVSSDSAALPGEGFDLEDTIYFINGLAEDEDNAGMLLYINSPGGEMGAADALYYALMDYKEDTGRPIYCYFDDTACSGGYYVAMPADEICANRNCLCVNIGVYISTYNFSGLMEKYGVEQVNIKSSENKGIGMAGTPWTDEQRAIYQSIVDIYYDQFLEVVAEGRGMTKDEVRERDDGREMLAVQALEAGFIDSIGRWDDYKAEVLSRFEEGTVLFEPEEEQSAFEQFLYSLRSAMPSAESKEISRLINAHSGMVVMAYEGTY